MIVDSESNTGSYPHLTYFLLKFIFKDGAVTDMSGFIFAVGNQDHPMAAVGANPKAANLNQTTIAKLTLTEVRK